MMKPGYAGPAKTAKKALDEATLSKVNRKPISSKIIRTIEFPATSKPQQYDVDVPLPSFLYELFTKNELPPSFPADTRIVMLPILIMASETPVATSEVKKQGRDDRGPSSSFNRGDRSKIRAKTSVYVYGLLTLDAARHEVRLGNRAIDLNPKEFSLLEYFLKHPGLVRTREMLLNAVWGYDYYGTVRTVDVHIRRLKKKIPLLTSAITCIHSLGYKLRESTGSIS